MEEKKEILFSPFPKQQEFINEALSGRFSFITFGGAIRGGKSYALLALFILLSRFFPGSRWAIVRKDLPTIKKNLYPSWDKIKPSKFIKSHNHDTHTVTFKNGSQIIFFPESYDSDKDLNRWKGLEVNGFGFEEINECNQQSLFKAFERAGAYIIKGAKIQPKPIVVATCNPTFGWFKDLVYTPWENKTLKPTWHYIQSRIYDNTPLLEQQPDYLPSLKANLNHYEYEVFVEGNWNVQLKTGGEALRNFEVDKHIKPVQYDSSTTIHISLDSNVYPYIGITIWQLIKSDGWIIRQIDELPCSDPFNTASQAGKAIVKYLKNKGYTGRVYLYGDRSTKSRNNIDDNKRSFFQIINETINNAGFKTVDKLLSYAPSVSAILDFVNAIYAGEIKGLSIEIGEHCKQSINDYIETKIDKDGSILKKRVPHPTIKDVSMEKNGHLTDTHKDFIVQAFHDEFSAYTNRLKKLLIGGISQPSRVEKITL